MTDKDGFASVTPSELPRRGTDRKRFDERPHAVREWLGNLPLASLGESARRVHAALTTLHTIGLSPEQRLGVLSQFEPCIDYLTEGLRKLYQQQPLPLPTRSRTAARMTVALHEEMARGYYLTLMTDKGRFIGLGPEHRTQASLQASRHVGLALLEHWMRYEQPPHGAWSMLHALWRDARKRELHRKRIDLAGSQPQRVDDLYKQLLLTEAAGPWQLPRGEVLNVHSLMGRYASAARLVPLSRRAAAEQATLIVDQSQDRGPGTRWQGAAVADHSLLQLITDALPRAFRAHNRKRTLPLRLARRINTDGTNSERLQRLATTLAQPPRQRHARRQTHRRPAAVVIGLNAIHRTLQARALAGQESEIETTASFTGRDASFDLGNDDDDIWRVIYTPRREAMPVDPNAQIWPQPGHGQTLAGTGHDHVERGWTIINSGGQGYCLAAEPGTHSNAQVGELIILAESGDTSRLNWQTGTIRWIKTSRSGITHMGVQRLASRPHPVFTRTQRAGGRQTDPARCLLLPAQPALNRPVTLLTPVLNHDTGRQLHLMGTKTTGELELIRQIEGTTLFRQFAFQRLDTRIAADVGKQEREIAWSSI